MSPAPSASGPSSSGPSPSPRVTELLERLFGLWTDQSPDDDEMLARFAACYTDPVLINGVPMSASELLARARAITSGLADVRRTVIDVVEGPRRIAFAFQLSGRHVGPLPTPAGPVPATSRDLDVLGIDILQLDEDDRIRAISVLSGLLDSLAAAGAVAVVG